MAEGRVSKRKKGKRSKRKRFSLSGEASASKNKKPGGHRAGREDPNKVARAAVPVGSNLPQIKRIGDHLDKFIAAFSNKHSQKDTDSNSSNKANFDENGLEHMENRERFGLQLFKQDHLYQYLDYLRGLQMELEVGDFYAAKRHYINSLVKRAYVNHRIRKESLLRLMGINKKIGFPKESPERVLLTRYYVKQKCVQIILDTSSFTNRKTVKATMNLPKMLFNDLEPHDFFGLKILKNGFDPTLGRSGMASPTYSGGPM